MNWLADEPWQVWRSKWNLAPGTIYLNHGSFGPPPRPVQLARQEWQQRLDRQPMQFFVREHESAYRSAIQALARFVGANPANLAFVDNATYAMNVIASSVKLKPGDEILVTDHEYGAVLRIWERACAGAGASLRTVRLPQPLHDAEELLDALVAATTERTRLLVISHITSPTAITFPIKAIVGAMHQRSILVCVDGPHAIAQLDLNMEQLGCDFYAASCHKWLSAPFGSGFLYVAPSWQSSIRPPILSWGRLKPNAPESWSDEFVWAGTRDPSSILAVPAAIQFFEELGGERFRQRTHALARYARQRLLDAFPGSPLVPDDPQWFTSMAHVPLADGDGETLQRDLWQRFGIEVPIIRWDDRRWIRVSCHLYNEVPQLDQLVDALQILLR